MEILENYCDLYGVTLDAAISNKTREQPVPLVKSKSIYDYHEEYPKTTLKSIGKWLGGMDHSSVSDLKKKANSYTYKPNIKDFSSFMNTTYSFVFKYG